MPEPIPVARVRALLAEEAQRRTLPREASLALQHAELFSRLPVEEVDKLIAELRTLPHVDASLAVKLADILPQYPEEIRLLFSRERGLLDEEQLNRLLETIARYR